MKLLRKLTKNKKVLYISIGVLLLLLAAVLVLVTKKEPVKEEKPKEEPTTEKVEETKLNIVDLNSTSRPYAIMINNVSVARPLQSGLQDAYIMYEMIVEGGITRYLALFLDQTTERIGSIRSARHYYLDYALENDAIYVHHGQSPQAQSDFSSLGIDRISVGNKTGWRDKSLNVASEHTLFTSIAMLNTGLGNMRTTRNGDLLLKYSPTSIDLASVANSRTANTVKIEYSGNTTSGYEYDAENKVYKRNVNGKAHVDYVTKEQYTFKNIITYQVANSNIAGDEKGRQTLNNIGSGTGYFISEGYAIPITWEKTSRGAKTIYKLENGEDLVVNDGNTFIQIQPSGKTLVIE